MAAVLSPVPIVPSQPAGTAAATAAAAAPQPRVTISNLVAATAGPVLGSASGKESPRRGKESSDTAVKGTLEPAGAPVEGRKFKVLNLTTDFTYSPEAVEGIMRRVAELEILAKERLSPARASLCQLIEIPSCQFSDEKKRVLHALLDLIENDPLNRNSAHDVYTMVRAIQSYLQSNQAKEESCEMQRLMYWIYASALELMLLHYSQGHLNAVHKDLFDKLKATNESIEALNKQGDIEILFHIACAKEATNRLKSDSSTSLSRIKTFIEGMQSIYNVNVVQGFEQITKAVTPSTTNSWYDNYIVLRGLIPAAKGNIPVLAAIIKAINGNGKELYDLVGYGNYICGGLKVLFRVAKSSQNLTIVNSAIKGYHDSAAKRDYNGLDVFSHPKILGEVEQQSDLAAQCFKVRSFALVLLNHFRLHTQSTELKRHALIQLFGWLTPTYYKVSDSRAKETKSQVEGLLGYKDLDDPAERAERLRRDLLFIKEGQAKTQVSASAATGGVAVASPPGAPVAAAATSAAS